MRSNALKKHDDYSQDNFQVIHELLETRRARIAIVAEEACSLPGNHNGPDLGEFEEKYLLGQSSFA